MKKSLLCILIFILICSCSSSPDHSSYQKESAVTVLEKLEFDNLNFDDGQKFLYKAIETYASKYSYYKMDIIIQDIQSLIDGNFERYKNGFEIVRIVKKDFTYYYIQAQHNCIIVTLLFSDKPFVGGITRTVFWEYNRQYSNGQYEKELAEIKHQAEWYGYFESRYNEAILKLSIERRKIPRGNGLYFYISDDLMKLEYYKTIKAMWFTAE